MLDFQNSVEDIQAAFRPYYESASIETATDPNQIYELESRVMTFGYLDRQEIERFATRFFGGDLTGTDRATLQGLIKQAVDRFGIDEEGRQEEFRQLCRSYLRFYSFIAQVIDLGDTSLEKLHTYLDWLVRMLPDRDVPSEIEITDDMLGLRKFRIEERERGSATLFPGSHEALTAIEEFGANPYTEDEQRELSEIVKAFNERHGTDFTESDMIRFEQVNRDILDKDLTDMLRKNPPDVVFNAYSEAFFAGIVRMFQRDTEMKNIILQDSEVREQATRHFFSRAMREAREMSTGWEQ